MRIALSSEELSFSFFVCRLYYHVMIATASTHTC